MSNNTTLNLLRRLNNYIHENPWVMFALQVTVTILVAAILIVLIWFLSRDSGDGGLTPTPPPEMVFDRDDYFVPNQIILTIPSRVTGQADRIIPEGSTEQEDIGIPEWLNPIQTLSTSDIVGITSLQPFCPGLPPNIDALSSFNINLYEIIGDRTVKDALEELNDPSGDYQHLIAEPNLIIGSPDYPTGSTSTWETVAVETRTDYDSQWAFELIERGTPNFEEAGKGIRVVIFDTVPSFIESDNNSGIESETSTASSEPTPYLVDWVNPTDPPMALQIDHGEPTPTTTSLTPPASSEEVAPSDLDLDLSHHGLFAAQMVYAIAPASEIELIRVLDNQTHGNLYTLIVSFYDALLSADIQLQPTVVNMSLGIRIPPPGANFQLPTQGVEALHTLVQLAYCKNIVVVAASGNNSIMSYPPELAHLPADWSSVIGVAASNMANQRSCFSNQGDIAAPGGDGRMPDDPIPGTPSPFGCQARLNECPAMGGSCPFAVVGPIGPPTEGTNETGLIYWDGSSFATPLVAGLAARILAESSTLLTPDDVRHIIECGATEATFPDGIEGHPDRHIGEGVINVKRTLEECMP